MGPIFYQKRKKIPKHGFVFATRKLWKIGLFKKKKKNLKIGTFLHQNDL